LANLFTCGEGQDLGVTAQTGYKERLSPRPLKIPVFFTASKSAQ